MPQSPLTLATAFAQCLDRNDFAGARRYLADDCRYSYASQNLIGPEAVLASYEQNYLSAKDQLDEIVFESRIEPISESVMRTHYTDKIRKGESRHEYRCAQDLRIAGDLIAEITHVELPGENERLKAFFASIGIQR